jgi:integration host factor subunit beta
LARSNSTQAGASRKRKESKAMNRSELVARLARQHPQYSPKDVELAIRILLDAVSGALVSGSRVEIRGFGTFQHMYRKPREGRNPKTGIITQVPAKYLPHFKPGKDLRVRVNEAVRLSPSGELMVSDVTAPLRAAASAR